MGRSDAKQQKELQMKIMKNHFNLKNEGDGVQKEQMHAKKSSYVQGYLKKFEFKNFKNKDTFLREGS